MADARLRELYDREQIKELKARYWRFVDTEDWEGFRQVLSDDVHVELPGAEPIEGADAFAAFVRSSTEGCWKTHQGHMPELTIEGPTEAHGIWALHDYKEWPSDPHASERRGFKGYGHYREGYRKAGGEWKIAEISLSYIRIDPLYPEPLAGRAASEEPAGGDRSAVEGAGGYRRADGASQPTPDVALLRELLDRAAIKQLKARYFESIDVKDWDALRALLADEATFELIGERSMEGADAFVEFAREALSGARSVHHGHNPQIEMVGAADARASWLLYDYTEFSPDPDTGARRGHEGYGRYEESYRKIDGHWKIATWRAQYSRSDPLPDQAVPDAALGGPDVVRQDQARLERVRAGYDLFGSASPGASGDPAAKPDDVLVQELLDREAISELKARYFRLVDAQDWEGWRELFTDDCRIDLTPEVVIEGGANFVAAVREMTLGAVTAHHGHMGDITIDGPRDAHGTWGLADYLEWPSDPETGERHGVKGYGHERETYRKVDGHWKIARMHLSYLRFDPLPLAPLPERVLGRPAEHLELALASSRTRSVGAQS